MKSNNHCVLAEALSQLQQRLTNELVAVTVELPGYSGIGVTTRGIVARNVQRWRQSTAQRLTRKGGS